MGDGEGRSSAPGPGCPPADPWHTQVGQWLMAMFWGLWVGEGRGGFH